MLKQPFVFRMYFNSEQDSIAACNYFLSFNIDADYLSSSNEEPAKWKVTVVSRNFDLVRNLIRNLKTRPTIRSEYVDPLNLHAGFKPIGTGGI